MTRDSSHAVSEISFISFSFPAGKANGPSPQNHHTFAQCSPQFLRNSPPIESWRTLMQRRAIRNLFRRKKPGNAGTSRPSSAASRPSPSVTKSDRLARRQMHNVQPESNSRQASASTRSQQACLIRRDRKLSFVLPPSAFASSRAALSIGRSTPRAPAAAIAFRHVRQRRPQLPLRHHREPVQIQDLIRKSLKPWHSRLPPNPRRAPDCCFSTPPKAPKSTRLARPRTLSLFFSSAAAVVVAGKLFSGISTINVYPPPAAAFVAVKNPSHSVSPRLHSRERANPPTPADFCQFAKIFTRERL